MFHAETLTANHRQPNKVHKREVFGHLIPRSCSISPTLQACLTCCRLEAPASKGQWPFCCETAPNQRANASLDRKPEENHSFWFTPRSRSGPPGPCGRSRVSGRRRREVMDPIGAVLGAVSRGGGLFVLLIRWFVFCVAEDRSSFGDVSNCFGECFFSRCTHADGICRRYVRHVVARLRDISSSHDVI